MVAAVAIGATVASTAGSAIAGSSAAGAQADATENAQAQANAEQQAMFQQAQQIQQPYTSAGSAALTQQQNLLGLNGQDAATQAMSTYQQSPGFQYQERQGLSAVDNGAAAQGMLRSGNTLRAEQTLGNNLASADFGNYYNRLTNLTQTGATAANALTGAALQTGSGIAGTDTSAGNQLSNIYGNQSAGLTNSLNNGLSNGLYTANKAGWLGGAGSNVDPFSGTGTGAATASTDVFG